MNYTQLVGKFGAVMVERLQENSHKSGWANCDERELLGSAFGELHELHLALVDKKKNVDLCDQELSDEILQEIREEAADVANFAMMIAINYGGLK